METEIDTLFHEILYMDIEIIKRNDENVVIADKIKEMQNKINVQK